MASSCFHLCLVLASHVVYTVVAVTTIDSDGGALIGYRLLQLLRVYVFV